MVWAAKASEKTLPLSTVEEFEQDEVDLENYYAKISAREGRERLGGSSSSPDDKEVLAPRSAIGMTGLGNILRRSFSTKSIHRVACVTDVGYGASSATAASPKGYKGVDPSLHTGTNQKSLVGEGTGSGRGGRYGGDTEHTVLKVVPADESSHGDLGVEMRIRLYPDGAMSKLLEEVASVRNPRQSASVFDSGPKKHINILRYVPLVRYRAGALGFDTVRLVLADGSLDKTLQLNVASLPLDEGPIYLTNLPFPSLPLPPPVPQLNHTLLFFRTRKTLRSSCKDHSLSKMSHRLQLTLTSS